MNKWSILGIIVGIAIAVTGLVRYWFVWYDPSQSLIFIGIGACVIAISWIWNVLKKLDFSLDAVEQWLQDEWRRRNE